MTPAARSIYLFGIYLVVVGAFMLGAPDVFVGLVRLPPPTDPWLRVLGVPVIGNGLHFIASARSEQTGFFRATVWSRFFVLASLGVLALLRLAPPILLVFGLVDAAGAIWTRLSLARGVARTGVTA